jgi:plasmid replication initiation protein
MRWVQSIEYHQGSGYVELTFTQHVAPYISLLHKQFTSYMLQKIARVTSSYAIRIFEFLMQYKNTGVVVMGIDEFKLLLELDQKYSRFSNLKARVIDPAVRELVVKAGLDITWEPIRTARTVTGLRFYFREQPQIPLSLD